MSITTMDGLVSAMSAGQIKPIYKANMPSKSSGAFHSLWMAGGNPSAGTAPGSTTGVACTKNTAGAIPFSNSAATGYLGKIS